MSKSIRFLGRFYGQILLCILAFAAVVLVGILVNPDTDSLFGMYFRMFPMLGVMIVAMCMVSMSPYCNLALSMNAGRPALFGAVQLGLLFLSLAVPAVTKLMWLLEERITGDAFSLPLPYLAMMASLGLVLGEVSLLVTGLEGKLRRVLSGVTFAIYIVACGIMGGTTAILADEDSTVGSVLASVFSTQTVLIVLAVSLILAAALAAANFMRMKKAVVQV